MGNKGVCTLAHSRTHVLIIATTWCIVRKTAFFAQVRAGERGSQKEMNSAPRCSAIIEACCIMTAQRQPILPVCMFMIDLWLFSTPPPHFFVFFPSFCSALSFFAHSFCSGNVSLTVLLCSRPSFRVLRYRFLIFERVTCTVVHEPSARACGRAHTDPLHQA